MYGQLTGFAEPLVAFPQVIMTAIVASLVPMVSAANKLNDRNGLHNTVSLGIRMATLLGFPCAIGMFVLSEPILLMLYPNQRESAISAVPCLQVLCIAFIFLALITIMTGALQGIGRQVLPVRNLFIGVLVKFAVTWVMTAIPAINIVGASIGTFTAYVVAATLDYLALKKYTGVKMKIAKTIFKPMIAAVLMGIIVVLAYKGIFLLLGSNSLATLISIMVGVVVYAVSVLRFKAIERDELMEAPMGRKLVVICDKLRLW